MEINVGIDFGTTSSSISIFCYSQPGPTLLKKDGRNKIPSIIYKSNNKLFAEYSKHFEKISHFKREINKISYEKSNKNLEKYVKFYLNYLKTILNKNYKKNVNCIFSVPTSFNHYHRSWYKNILESLDFNVKRIISEPSAAAIAYYYFNKKSKAENIIVFDLGGGTTDISILEKDDEFYQVIFNKGDLYLGGDDFTIEIQNNLNISWEEAEKRKLKNDISDIKYYQKTLDKLEDLIKIILENTNLDDIDDVILVGNGLKLIGVMQLLQKYFNNKIRSSKEQEYLVSYGTCILNNTINSESCSDLVLVDSTSLSIGIETADLNFSIIIPSNSALPATGIRKYLPSNEEEDEISLNIYQGEKSLAIDNELVGKLVIPANEKKYVDSIYQVILKLDLNGIIYIKIKDLSDKEYYYDKVLKFEKSENVEDLQELDSEDINKRDFRKNKYEMKKIIENIKLALSESKLEKEDIENVIEEIELLDKNSVDYVTSVKYVEELKEKYGHLQYDVDKDVETDVKKDVINDNYSDNLYNKYLKDKLKAFLDLEKVDKSDSLKEIINNTLEEFDNFEQMEIKIKISEIESILENSDDLDDYNEFKELIYFIEFQMESNNLDINVKQKISLEKRLVLEKSYLKNTKLDFKEKINSFNLFCEKLLE